MTTQIDTRGFSTVLPTDSAVVPVQAPPVPAPLPPKEPLITVAKARNFLEKTDLDGSRSEHGGNRTWATFNNGLAAVLAAGHCIPGVSLICAPLSMGWGGLKIAGALFAMVPDMGAPPGIARGLLVSGGKSFLLGASVFLLPGVSEALSAASALKDGADAVNAAVDPS